MRESIPIGKEKAYGRLREQRMATTSAAAVPALKSNAAARPRPSGGSSLLSCPAELRGDAIVSPERRSSAARRRGGAASRREAAQLAHDARNLLSALNLYCELLSGPGVLTPGYRHYAEDLRVVGETGARLVEALALPAASVGPGPRLPLQRRPFPGIEDLAAEVLVLESPLRALAGPGVRLEVEFAPCAGLLALNSEDLLRILFNLVANAVEAMGALTGAPRPNAFLRITAQCGGGASFLSDRLRAERESVVLSVRDNGPGIAAKDLGRIFDAGFSTRDSGDEAPHGMGLAIVRQLVEAAGGEVRAVSSPGVGTRFDIELPLLAQRTPTPLEFGARRCQAEQNKPENSRLENDQLENGLAANAGGGIVVKNFVAQKRERGIRC